MTGRRPRRRAGSIILEGLAPKARGQRSDIISEPTLSAHQLSQRRSNAAKPAPEPRAAQGASMARSHRLTVASTLIN